MKRKNILKTSLIALLTLGAIAGVAKITYDSYSLSNKVKDNINESVRVKIGLFKSIEMTDVSKEKGETDTWLTNYHVVTDLSKGDKLVFSYMGKEIRKNIGFESGQNNATFDETNGVFTIHNDAEKADIYLKKFADGGYSVWISGYIANVE